MAEQSVQAIEDGLELATVQKCLIFMEGHIIAMMSDNCRTDYSDCFVCFESTISDSKGDSRYKGMPDSVIPCFWRDLLLMAIIQGDKAVLTKFRAHKDTSTLLTDLLLVTPGPERDQERNKEDLQFAWHTDAMKDAMPQLRAFLKR